MKTRYSAGGVLLLAVLSFVLVSGSASPGTLSSGAAVAEGFSALASTNALFVFDSLDDLKRFTASRVIPVPLSEPVVSTAGNSNGDFVVLGGRSAAALNSSGQFQQTVTFSTDYTFSDVAFSSKGAFALGVGSTGLIALSSSQDGGFTWSPPSTSAIDQRSAASTGSISFGSDDFGVAGFGGYVATSSDGGSTWTVPQTSVQKSETKVVVMNQGLSAIAGSYSLTTGTIFLDYSTNGWQSFSEVQLPGLTPPRASINGIALSSDKEWIFVTGAGEIWRTVDGAQSWKRVANFTNVAWVDVTWSSALKTYVASGQYSLQGPSGALAYSEDGVNWVISSPIPVTATFIRIVPVAPAAPAPSPSISPSPSASPSTVLPSSSPSSSPSTMPVPSPSESPSRSPSPSPSPSMHTASPTPSVSPSKHTASPTPSASPSKGAPHSPSSSPSPSPSPSPAKKNDGDSKLPLILGLSLGLGGGAALIGGVMAVYFYRRFSSRGDIRYQPINIGDV